MSGRPVKHSLTLKGHRTSVSLEAEFWEAFQGLARARGLSVNELAAEVDEGRRDDVGLASAIRVFVLEAVRGDPPRNRPQGPISRSRSASE